MGDTLRNVHSLDEHFNIEMNVMAKNMEGSVRLFTESPMCDGGIRLAGSV